MRNSIYIIVEVLEHGVAEERGDGVEDTHVHPVAHQQENVAGVRHQVPRQ